MLTYCLIFKVLYFSLFILPRLLFLCQHFFLKVFPLTFHLSRTSITLPLGLNFVNTFFKSFFDVSSFISRTSITISFYKYIVNTFFIIFLYKFNHNFYPHFHILYMLQLHKLIILSTFITNLFTSFFY